MKKSIYILFITVCINVNGQFNTLTFNDEIEKIDNFEINLQSLETKEENKNSGIFSGKKRKLKHENDSLRKLVNLLSVKTINENNYFLQHIISQQSNKQEIPVNIQNVKNSSNEFKPITNKPNINLSMPISGEIIITSGFGSRYHPILKDKRPHNGIDIKANNEPVKSILDGEVTADGWDINGGGLYIKIKHSDKYETLYMHLSQLLTKKGDYVKAGDIIGISGNTGNSTGPHLHFAVKENGKFIEPSSFLNQLIFYNNLIH
ncbi:MAG: M23 family metallopeptidase [Weeksellaceae bacterium]|nr:M23 family metallopeptidase [Acholeplasmataceae bacterium]